MVSDPLMVPHSAPLAALPAFAPPKRNRNARLTRPIPNRTSNGTHPPREARNDTAVGEDERKGDTADEEDAREEVAKVDGAGRVVFRGEVLGGGALAAEEVGQGREGEDGGCGRERGVSLAGRRRGEREGDAPVRRGSQFDQRAQERMMRRNESASTNDNRTAATERQLGGVGSSGAAGGLTDRWGEQLGQLQFSLDSKEGCVLLSPACGIVTRVMWRNESGAVDLGAGWLPTTTSPQDGSRSAHIP